MTKFDMHTDQNLNGASVYIGMMSGTSLDGVDGVLVRLPATDNDHMELLGSAYIPFSEELRQQASQLQQPGANEIHREALLANDLAQSYFTCVHSLLAHHPELGVKAIGVHGQTIRHRPELGFTRQTNNPALLAELTGIDVIADFRSRDVAAGGQGAPLVPAFHRAIFAQKGECRVVANIGGISNISVLAADGKTTGFDTGPGNVLMDYWIKQHQGVSYDADGAWAAQGTVNDALLAHLMDEPYLQQAPPKSTGRDLFHADWLLSHLHALPTMAAVNIQATLCAFTAHSLAQAILKNAAQTQTVYVCGGGAYNSTLMKMLAVALKDAGANTEVQSTAQLGVAPEHVEALAFAWLAQQFCLRQAGNLPEVTGAKGLRVLGALYPA